MSNTIKCFKELIIRDVSVVGGKNASLGEMIRTLSGKGTHSASTKSKHPSQEGIRVPDGFVITS